MTIAAKKHSEQQSDSTGGKLVGYVAEFKGPVELKEAAAKMHQAGFSKFDCYSPFPIHGIDDAMGTKRTILPFIVLACAFCGGITAFGLEWFTNGFDYKYIISGKPTVSIPSNMPVVFELSVLFSAFGAFLGMLALNGLPRLYNALLRVDHFRGVTQDKFFLGLESDDPQFDEDNAKQFLNKLAPVNLTPYYESTESKAVPSVFFKIVILAGVLGLVPLAFLYNLNVLTSDKPRFQIVQDMDFQPKLKTQKASNMFADGRGMRPIIAGTVARGRLEENSELHRGLQSEKADGVPVADLLPNALGKDGQPIKLESYAWVKDFPVEVNSALMNRGQQRYGIYCAPCHGQSGAGDGLVTERANQLMLESKASWVKPVSLYSEPVKNQPVGQLFNTITHGVRKMPGYGSQIPVNDRWAIVLYLKALQRSQTATAKDVPSDVQSKMPELPKLEEKPEEVKPDASKTPVNTTKPVETPAKTETKPTTVETKKEPEKKPTAEEQPKTDKKADDKTLKSTPSASDNKTPSTTEKPDSNKGK